MYYEFNYLNADILNEFEQEIKTIYENNHDLLLTTYTPKEWTVDEFIYVDDIKNIEDAIEYIGKKVNYPTNWQISRVWILNGNNNISYRDLNRWFNNLNVIKETINKLNLNYCGSFYCGEEVSL